MATLTGGDRRFYAAILSSAAVLPSSIADSNASPASAAQAPQVRGRSLKSGSRATSRIFSTSSPAPLALLRGRSDHTRC